MGTAKWNDKPNGDPNWTHVGSLGGLIVTSHDAPPFDANGLVYGLNPYAGSKRLIGGRGSGGDDEGLWIDQIQGYETSGLSWSHAGQTYPIIRCARIPYVIKARSGTRKKEYLDHLLVGYGNSNTSGVTVTGTIYSWNNLLTGNSGNGNIRELGTFLVEDLWPANADPPRAIQNWWKPSGTSTDPPTDYGYWITPYGTAVKWKFREILRDVYGSVRICVADQSRNLRYLFVGYEGGGGW
jgi:hypothetical protein